jgi:hypothetical protein
MRRPVLLFLLMTLNLSLQYGHAEVSQDAVPLEPASALCEKAMALQVARADSLERRTLGPAEICDTTTRSADYWACVVQHMEGGLALDYATEQCESAQADESGAQ